MASHQSDPAEARQPVLYTSLRNQKGPQLEKSGCNSVRTLSLIPAKTSQCPSITSASTTPCSPFCQLSVLSPPGSRAGCCCHPVLSSSGSSNSCGHVTTFTHLWTLGPPHGPASEFLGTRLFSVLCPVPKAPAWPLLLSAGSLPGGLHRLPSGLDSHLGPEPCYCTCSLSGADSTRPPRPLDRACFFQMEFLPEPPLALPVPTAPAALSRYIMS